MLSGKALSWALSGQALSWALSRQALSWALSGKVLSWALSGIAIVTGCKCGNFAPPKKSAIREKAFEPVLLLSFLCIDEYLYSLYPTRSHPMFLRWLVFGHEFVHLQKGNDGPGIRNKFNYNNYCDRQDPYIGFAKGQIFLIRKSTESSWALSGTSLSQATVSILLTSWVCIIL